MQRARVEGAIRRVARAGFLPPDQVPDAWRDEPLPIGRGATNSQPSTVRDMLVLLNVPVGARVLDVGAGSGWTTALLVDLAGPDGQIFATELEPDLVAFGNQNLTRAGLGQRVQIEPAVDGMLGWPQAGPYDRILVSAMADALPVELVAQLAEGGVMVIPVAGVMQRVVRDGDATVVTAHGRYRFVPLRARRANDH